MSEPDDSAVPQSHVSGSPPAPGQAGVVVDVAGVQHAYRRTMALRGVDLSVAAGEVVASPAPAAAGSRPCCMSRRGWFPRRPDGCACSGTT
jgi:hypothetical protein